MISRSNSTHHTMMKSTLSFSQARRKSVQIANAWDRLGVLLSGLCAVHCLALPILVLVMPLWHGSEFLHAAFHPVMAALVMPVTLRSIHRDSCGSDLLRIGLAVIWIALPVHAFFGELPGLALTLFGSAMLISGHRGNIQCRTETTK